MIYKILVENAVLYQIEILEVDVIQNEKELEEKPTLVIDERIKKSTNDILHDTPREKR